jgi:hypothetical protein
MGKNTPTTLEQFMAGLRKRNPGQSEFPTASAMLAYGVV